MVKKKILIVEDSRLALQILKDNLTEYGYIVDSCTKGEEAIKKVYEDFPPDLILMDIELEGKKDGIDTAQQIQKIKAIPILFLTANASKEILDRVKTVGSYGFIPKGTDKYVLLSSIEAAIRLADATAEVKLYQDIYEYTLNELYTIHPETLKFMAANRAARKKLGYTMEELKEMTPADIKPEFDLETFKQLISPLVNGEKKEITFETVHRRKNGFTYPVEVSLKLNKYLGKKLIVAAVQDLTERKKLEEERRKREENLYLMMEGIPSPAWLVSRERRIMAQNKVAEEIFKTEVGDYCWEGIQNKEYLEKKYREAYEKTGIPLPGTKCLFCRGDEALEKRKSVNSELEFKGRTWDTWWIPLGEDIYLHYATDVTRYKKTEETLRQREEYLNLLLTSMPVGVITVDALSHRIEDVNQEAAALMGAPPEAIKGKSCFEFFSCRKGRCPVRDLGEEVDRAERILRRTDGVEIPVLKTVKHFQIDSGEKIIETFMDLTERKKMEEQLYSLSISDNLTNAYNRRYFTQKLVEEIERTRRNGNRFSLIMLDIDHFKNINDSFGHNAGDMVLKSLVEVISSRIRKIDTLGRWGGEEFVILLPDTTVKNAVCLAEELRKSLSHMDIPGVARVTASFGVAGYCLGDSVDTLVQRADNLMYEAKAAGRNCVRSCP